MAQGFLQSFQNSPKNAPTIQRSKLLADFLAQSLSPETNPQSTGELAARLGATAIAKWGSKRADKDLASALEGDRQSRAASVLEALRPKGNPALADALTPQPMPKPTLAAPSGTITQTPLPDLTPQQADPVALAMTLDPGNRSNGKLPLGVRQNNPGNIRDTPIPWKGATGSGGGFETFDSPENGLRAMARNLNTYAGRGLNTVEGIVGKWAPSSENDTSAYVANVAKRMGTDPRKPLNMKDAQTVQSLMSAMIQQENGQQPYTAQQLAQAAAAGMGLPGGANPSPAAPLTPPSVGSAPQTGQPQPIPPAQQQPQGLTPPSQPQQAQQPFGQPLGPTPQEMAMVERYLADPQTFDQGLEMAQKIQLRMAEPRKFATSNINGVPVWQDEYNPGSMQTGAVPDAAMSHTASAQQLGIPAPPGATFSVDPTGKPSQVYAPPAGYQTGDGNRMAAVPGGPSDPLSGQNLIQGEQAIRKEYEPLIKDYNEARNGFQKVVAAANDQTGASDIALIFGFMKTLDPSSTVREGEFATAQNSGSISQSVLNAYNKAIAGERLQPEQRQEFAKTAASQFKVYEQRKRAVDDRFRGIATSYGYNPDRIVQVSEAAPSVAAPRAAPQRPASKSLPVAPGAKPAVKWDD